MIAQGIKSVQPSIVSFSLILLLVASGPLVAQEGHPLTGTWSGDRVTNGETTRVLLILSLQPDQVISGTLIENGARISLSEVVLDPEDWSVSMKAAGKDRAGNDLSYEIEGVIENLGSVSERMIVGTWRGMSGSGEFRINLN